MSKGKAKFKKVARICNRKATKAERRKCWRDHYKK